MRATEPPSLSTHVLDTERGGPAAGVPVTLSRVQDGGSLVPLDAGETDHDGRVPGLGGAALEPGLYQLHFDAAAYFGAQAGDAPFLTGVVIEFRVQPDGGHYHVPLLLSRYSCTSYRGS